METTWKRSVISTAMGAYSPTSIDEALEELIGAYHGLNGCQVDELDEVPSPLLFLQYVAKNRPFVVRRAASAWPAVKLWNVEYMINVLGDASVKVAVTPLGSVWTWPYVAAGG